MSRIDKNRLWETYFGNSLMELCMCCKNVLIYKYTFGDHSGFPVEDEKGIRKIQKGKRNWQRGHIIPARLNGPDIIENLNPICLQCNINDKKYDSNYHYRQKMGLITNEEVKKGIQFIWNCADDQKNNPLSYECIATVCTTMAKCKNKRLPHNWFCGVHAKKDVFHCKIYSVPLLASSKSAVWSLIKECNNKDEELSTLLKIEKEIDDLEKSFHNKLL